jgi:hypothetical protein
MRHTIIAALGAAVLGAALAAAPAPASAEGVRAPDLTRVYPNESYSQTTGTAADAIGAATVRARRRRA